jgi:hypothetical protein
MSYILSKLSHNANLPGETILVKNYSFAFFAFLLMFFAKGLKMFIFFDECRGIMNVTG